MFSQCMDSVSSVLILTAPFNLRSAETCVCIYVVITVCYHGAFGQTGDFYSVCSTGHSWARRLSLMVSEDKAHLETQKVEWCWGSYWGFYRSIHREDARRASKWCTCLNVVLIVVLITMDESFSLHPISLQHRTILV